MERKTAHDFDQDLLILSEKDILDGLVLELLAGA